MAAARFSMIYTPDEALAHLRRDPALDAAIERLGPFTLDVRPRPPYLALMRSILYQQLAGKAAATIHGRLQVLLGDDEGDPEALLALSDEAIRGAGVSGNKMAALRDLAAHTLEGTVPDLGSLATLDDEAIIERLTRVRGVGRWTVEMLLIFTLGRPDVWPVDDLGVRRGVQIILGLDAEPTPRALPGIGEAWRPYRSVVAWYAWRAADAAKGAKARP